MKYIEILTGFETEIGLINNTIQKPATDDSLFWLNQAVAKFIKLRFNGDFTHKMGYEQTEKRREDLINLYKTVMFEPEEYIKHATYWEYDIKYPSDFLYLLNEDVVISDNNGDNLMDTCVFECTSDSFMYRITNSLTDFHYRYKKARPLRVRTVDGCQLLTDTNYKVNKYTLGYLRQPNEITLDNPFGEYEDFQDIVMHEIIKMAAQMYLENIASQRYQTITQEVLTQE